MILCGLDVGTQGARCILVSDTGEVLGQGECALGQAAAPGLPEGWFEQEPAHWLASLTSAVHQAAAQCDASGVAGISVTSTSGTLCAVGPDGAPLERAIMYSDCRSAEEAEAVQAAGAQTASRLGYRFGPSYGLPKIVWLKRHRPDLFARARMFVSPTDFIIGWLTGRWGRTDQTNALKYGYDLLEGAWPAYIETELGIPLSALGEVQTSGQPAGELLPGRAEELGLPALTAVAAGLTDGCASQVSSGAVAPGDCNTTIGTTLVVKGVTERLLVDPQGRLYCHRHPEGWWLPGGASNTGAECLSREFGEGEIASLGARALSLSPTSLVAYPLVGRGERFPFRCAGAEPFLLGEPADRAARFTAYLEGVACLERMALELIEGLGGDVGERVYSAGGGSHSAAWLQIRADVLGRTVLRPQVTGGDMGAAIVAASMSSGLGLSETARRMVRIEREVEPRAGKAAAYGEQYDRFCNECRRRGYLDA